MYIKARKKTQFLLEIIMIVIGTILMGFGFSFFLSPSNISTGGFSGIAMIINALLKKVGINFVSNAIIYFILNIGLFAYAYKTLGKKFAIKALIGIASYSLFMQIIELIPVTSVYEPLISSIYGGVLMGAGIGLVVRFGGSTGGSDMVASIIRRKKKDFSIGQLVVIIDMAVIICSLFVFSNGLEIIPYTLIALFFSVYITDLINDGYKKVSAFYIITNQTKAISEEIMLKLGRGCTLTKVTGMYGNSDKDCLTCLISRYQKSKLISIIKSIDPTAFVYSTSVSDVVGTWSSTSKILNEVEYKEDESKTSNKSKKSTTKKIRKQIQNKTTSENK